jgi:hypothetical protein
MATEREEQIFVVDRIVDGVWVVLEPLRARAEGEDAGGSGPKPVEVRGADAEPLTIPRSWLPVALDEGDVLRVQLQRADKSVTLIVAEDLEARRERMVRMEALRAQIPRGPSGPLKL